MDDSYRQPSLPGFETETTRPSNQEERTAVEAASRPEKATSREGALELRPATAPPETLEGKSVWVIDCHALIYQTFHALPEMTGPSGEPVGAIFGFARDLLSLIDQKRPDYLFCAFDLPGKTFRHGLFDDYKVHRKPMPDDLIPQIPYTHRLVDALEIPALACETYEADDVMATVARIADDLGGQCFVVTADKDCRQLITDRVTMYNIRKGEVFDRTALKADWGIEPCQVVDFQALVGDKADNVPGVPLIGPKLACQLLETYGTLDAVLDHADNVSGKKRKENLKQYRDQALLSRDLVRLDREVPVAIDWDRGRVGPIDRDAALELFGELGFRNMDRQLEAIGAAPAATRPPAVKAKYRLVDTPEALARLVAEMSRQKRISLDTETTSVWPRWAEIVGYSFAWKDDEAWYVPVRAPEGERCLDPDATLEALRPVLENSEIEKVGQNLKYDMIVLRSAGIDVEGVHVAGVAFDTMVASYLLDAGRRNHNLDDLADRYLGHKTIKISELIGSGKKQIGMDEVPVADVTNYAAEDALVPLLLHPLLESEWQDKALKSLYRDLELPLIDVLAEMEFNGICVDVERLRELGKRYGERLDTLEEEIYDLAGHEFNIASPKQLQQVLFTELGLPVVKKTKTGPSTDANVLAELAPLHALPAKIVEYRQYAKLKNTYVDALPEMVCPRTGRVHASFNQVVAATGRLSSSDPNLQNIPVRTDEGREIRSAFVPGEKDWFLLAADYSQIELRVLAHCSGDEQLCQAFANDEDIHARVASQVNEVPLEEVTATMRREAKAVNFGVVYGQSAFGLARSLDIDKDVAAKFIDDYFAQYPGIDSFLLDVLAKCRQTGYVSTILGRRRSIAKRQIRESSINEKANRQRNLAERTAINTVIQGSAADLIKLAMVAIHRRLLNEKTSAKMLLQIHDELIFEVPAAEVDQLAKLVVEEMVGVWQVDVPLKVDVKVGPNWADAKKIEVA